MKKGKGKGEDDSEWPQKAGSGEPGETSNLASLQTFRTAHAVDAIYASQGEEKSDVEAQVTINHDTPEK